MKVSLGLLLAVCLAGLQFLAVTFVVFSSYLTSERVLLDHARNLLSDVGLNTIQNARGFLYPARAATELASQLAENEVIASHDLELLEKLLFQQLRLSPQFAGVYYGDEGGNFVYVKRDTGLGPFRTKIIKHVEGQRETELIWRDNKYNLVRSSLDPNDTFDPRLRPWYQQAAEEKLAIWTDPYIFFTSQQPGISVASPVFDQDGDISGVIGVDIEISDISRFLASLEIGENGRALIINRNGDVIAHPDQSLISTEDENGGQRFVSIDEIGDPVARAAFGGMLASGEIGQAGETTSTFVVDGEKYVYTVKPRISDVLPWTIAVYAPENDFIGAIKSNRVANIWIAAGIALLTGIAGVFLALWIYRPVEAFAVRSALISQGELSPSDPLPSTYAELERVNETLVHEIAERKKSQREYGRTFDFSTRGMAQVEPETGLILRANARFGEIFGYEANEILELSLKDLCHPEDVETFLNQAAGEEPNTDDSQERRCLTRDGSVLWLNIHAIMIRDDNGEPLHAVVTIENVSHIKEKEKEIQQLNRDLVHTARVNMMSHMATSLAHELNQPLTAITQNMDAALHMMSAEAPGHDLEPILRESETQAHRAGDIIRSLRDFLLKDEVLKEDFDLSELIEQSLQLLRSEARVNGVFVGSEVEHGTRVKGSRVQIAQVLVNLVRNGIEAIADDNARLRDILVTAKVGDKDAIISVVDTGPGFAEGFDPFARFETTKKDGMGLGLSICKTIVEAHGGKLWFERSDTRSHFCFSLPRATKE
ncbi:MAG: PAS domain S-box protein [Rhodobacteraceae bacterium]|nr:PAS domain S-box protein [Paracoccaceae bacterium]